MVVCNHLIGLWEILVAAAWYPFVSLGGAEISAVFLCKTAALLALAMLVLQRARYRTEEALEQRTRLAPGTATSVATLGYYAAAVLAVLIILGAVGINLTRRTVIFGALGVGIGFGLNNILNNLVGGIIVLALFVFITALINRNTTYILFSAWLVVNLRMAALSAGWDQQWLGRTIPYDLSLIPL